MLNAPSVVLLLLLYDLSPYHQVSRAVVFRQTQGKHWHIKGLFSEGPLETFGICMEADLHSILVEFSNAGCLLAAFLFFCLAQILLFFLYFSLSLRLAFASKKTIGSENDDRLHCGSAVPHTNAAVVVFFYSVLYCKWTLFTIFIKECKCMFGLLCRLSGIKHSLKAGLKKRQTQRLG